MLAEAVVMSTDGEIGEASAVITTAAADTAKP